jgi:hypothetical protein
MDVHYRLEPPADLQHYLATLLILPDYMMDLTLEEMNRE